MTIKGKSGKRNEERNAISFLCFQERVPFIVPVPILKKVERVPKALHSSDPNKRADPIKRVGWNFDKN